jgi:hypothetical protein
VFRKGQGPEQDFAANDCVAPHELPWKFAAKLHSPGLRYHANHSGYF